MKAPTTEELFDKYKQLYQFEEGSPEYLIDKEDFKSAMIEFAKFHVQTALEAADSNKRLSIDSEEVDYASSGFEDMDKGSVNVSISALSILNAYPLYNIK